MNIQNYHAHVYFSPGEEADKARRLSRKIESAFGESLKIGRWHDSPVGPHPRGSYQITVDKGDMERVFTWLMAHRDGLTVFCHANAGDDLIDHTDYVLWLGESETLNLELFRKS